MNTTHRRFFKFHRAAALAAVLMTFVISTTRVQAAAAPPDRMTYQGFLVDANGSPLAPVTPVNYPVTFRIYTNSTGGTPLWAENQTVTVDKGNFSVLLGEGALVSGEPKPALSTVFTNSTASDRYVSITVTIGGTPQVILPRLRLVPSPYSFLASSANKLVQTNNGAPYVNYDGTRVSILGNTVVAGTFTANSFAGNGAGLTNFGSAQIPEDLSGERTFSTGPVGIGTTSPGARLHVVSSSEVNPASGGDVVVGISSGLNIAMDSDEIQARNNGSALTLNLNPHGGYVVIGNSSQNAQFGLNKAYSDVTATIRQAVASADKLLLMENLANQQMFVFTTNGVAQKPGGGTWAAISDARLKTVTGKFQYGLEAVAKLNAIRYHYNKDNPEKLASDSDYSGFVAQELQKVIPEAVTTNNHGYLTVSLDPVYLAGIHAIQQLNEIVKKKDSEIAALRERVTKVEALEQELAAIKKEIYGQQQASAAWEARFAALEKLMAGQNAAVAKPVRTSAPEAAQ